MSEVSRLEILAEYGYTKDPFRFFRMETADYLRLKRVVKMAIDSHAMISVVASWGFGKTSALDLIFRDIDAKVVRLHTPDKERVVVSDIEKGLVLGLSNESCKRTKEVRARQIRRILGEASKEKPVVLILEEAHRMHPSTLRALKTFREMDWMGRSPLFTVIMVGQYDPMQKRGVDEVRLRTDSVVMKGLTASEVKDYIKHTVGRHFEDDALEAIAKLDESRNFLDLQEIVLNVMRNAMENGSKKVTALEVFEVYGGGIQEVLKRIGLKQSDVEKALGIPKSSLSLALGDRPNTMTPDKNREIKDAVTDYLKKQMTETTGKGLRVVGGE
ncbi:ATPase AAA [hot springs metagenome]|uniref:ATPase AAA n=1 Tax=hot springs metagenome TaxID=433727 RepID=A0A5J4KYV5_9ZZZZ